MQFKIELTNHNHRMHFSRYAESAMVTAIFRDFDICMLYRLLSVSPRRASVSWHRRHRVDTPFAAQLGASCAFARTLVLSLAHAARWVCRAVPCRVRESELPYVSTACWHNAEKSLYAHRVDNRHVVLRGMNQSLRRKRQQRQSTHLALRIRNLGHELYGATTTFLARFTRSFFWSS